MFLILWTVLNFFFFLGVHTILGWRQGSGKKTASLAWMPSGIAGWLAECK
jgi:hypothetical protein